VNFKGLLLCDYIAEFVFENLWLHNVFVHYLFGSTINLLKSWFSRRERILSMWVVFFDLSSHMRLNSCCVNDVFILYRNCPTKKKKLIWFLFKLVQLIIFYLQKVIFAFFRWLLNCVSFCYLLKSSPEKVQVVLDSRYSRMFLKTILTATSRIMVNDSDSVKDMYP
jgi:hypothetical protein